MKKLYEKYLKVSENEKISDSVFKSRIILSVIAILACMTMMVSTAFAFFSSNTSKSFTMNAAVWDIDVKEKNYGRISSVYTCLQTEGEVHEFTLSPCGTASQGYCIIEIKSPEGDVKEYCTTAFKGEKTLKIQAVAGCAISFIPRWGKPDNYNINELCGGNIIHSFTPPPEETSEEDDKTDKSSETAVDGEKNAEKPSGASGGAVSDKTDDSSEKTENSSDKPEESEDKTEAADSGEASKENSENASAASSSSKSQESDSSGSDESASSSDSSKSSESSKKSETTSAASQSASDSNSSPSQSSTASGNSSESGSSSASGGETSSAKSPSSKSGSSSVGGESSSSGASSAAGSSDGGSAE
ncbi:MAG: hypothetical protein IKW59_02545 [Clostridia bacterium]|nr:hypothetical protein [Clostridia bacterium]